MIELFIAVILTAIVVVLYKVWDKRELDPVPTKPTERIAFTFRVLHRGLSIVMLVTMVIGILILVFKGVQSLI